MNILEIYKKYQIMPQLQEHQLTVAAVADMICENITLILPDFLMQKNRDTFSHREKGAESADHENIVSACLLHDMGNIVKFDLTKTSDLHPELFLKPEDQIFWESVKQEFIKKYGIGSHNVTMKIVQEIGVSPRVKELVDCVGFDQGTDNAATADFGKKICAYSDMRVMPAGVCGLEQRMADLRVRYKNHPEGAHNREVFEAALRKIEKQIFEYCSIKPEDITEEAIAGRKEKLKSSEI
jgi:hypothetical protein